MLESYVTPILMSYVNRYIKNLKPSDLQLSLWGGDVVLSKLELKLDVLEQELKLPFTFLSGHIHELRIHVPWTKLGSEPVVITINTMECILKLKDGIQDDHESCGSNSTNRSTAENSKSSLKPRRIQQAAPADPDLPPGYVQSLIRRVVNNVNIVINNLILKYVEDDIVLSVNITSAECYTVSELWDRAFMDISATDLVLRKVINFSDCTVCLDKRNASGKIEFYQDPLLYKCSFRTRLHFTYDNLNSKMPSIIKIHTLVESLKLSITDQQLPMFIRIMQLGIALYYGEIGNFKDIETEDPTSLSKDMLGNITGPEDETRIEMQYSAQYKGQELYSQDNEEPQGWVSWAWSFVPAIVSYDDGEEDCLGNDPASTMHQQKAQTLKDPIVSVGFYCTKATVTFKLTEMQAESSYYSPQKVKSKEVLCWEQEGTTIEALMMGEAFFDCQIGFVGCRAICLKGIMGVKDFEEHMNRSETEACFFICGENLSTKGLTYLTNSLFDYRSPENNGTRAEFILDAAHHKETYTEIAGMQRFGAFYMDYLYTMEHSSGKGPANQQDFPSGKNEDLGIVQEKSTKSLVIGPLDFRLDSSAVHRILKMVVCALEHEYEPYSRLKLESKDEKETVLNPEEVASLEEYIPTRHTSVTLLKCTCTIFMAEFNLLDHLLPVIKGGKNSSNFMNATNFQLLRPLPSLQILVDKINLEHSVPMYAEQLVHVVSSLPQPSDNLLHYCYVHYYLKVFGFQAGLTCLDPSGSYCSPAPVIPSFSTALYGKLLNLPTLWTKRSQTVVTEGIFELPNLTIQATRAQTLLLQAIYQSWSHIGSISSSTVNEALMNEVFQMTGVKSKNPLPTLEGSIQNVELKYCSTSLVKCASGTMGSIKICAKAPGDSGKERLVPLLQGPSDTRDLHCTKWLNESRKPESLLAPDLIAFTIQVPHSMDYCHHSGAVFLCSIQGLAVNIDPILYTWVIYQPQKRTSRYMQQPVVALPLVPSVNRRKEDELSVGSAPLAKQQSYQASEYASSPIKTKTVTESRPLSVPVKAMLHINEGCRSPEERMKEFIGLLWNAVKSLTLQLDVQSCCVFIPNDSLPSPSTIVSGDIPGTVRSWYHGQTSIPGTLVLCLPQIKIISAGHKYMEPLQEIPFVIPRPILEEGDAFPWTISLHHFSIYTLFGKQVTLSLVEPMGCTSTLAVTSQKLLPLGPDGRHSFVVCLHVDLESLEIKCSNPQVQLFYELADTMSKVWNTLQKRGSLSPSSVYPETMAGPVPCSPVRSSVGTAPPDTSTCSPSADIGTTTEGTASTECGTVVLSRRKALNLGILRDPGSEIEDRQYQIDLQSINIGTAQWDQLKPEKGGGVGGVPTENERNSQNPALEWNMASSIQRHQERRAILTPILTDFSVRITGAPAIIFTKIISPENLHLEKQEQKKMDTFDGGIAETSSRYSGAQDSGIGSDSVKIRIVQIEQYSGASQHRIARPSHQSSIVKNLNFIPFDIFITASRISLMTYSSVALPKFKLPGQKEDGKAVKNSLNLQVVAKPNQACISMVTGEDLLGSNTTFSSRKKIRLLSLESLHASTRSSARQALGVTVVRQPGRRGTGDLELDPFLYLVVSQPSLLLSCHHRKQRMEISVFDAMLKGVASDYKCTDPGKTLPEALDYNTVWLQTVPGETDSKSGIPPSLVTLQIKDFLNGPADINLDVSKPLKANLSFTKLDQINHFLKKIKKAHSFAQSKEPSTLSDSILNKDEPPISKCYCGKLSKPKVHCDGVQKTSLQENMWRAISFFQKVSVHTTQIVVLMETVPHPHKPCVLASLSNLNGSLSAKAAQKVPGVSLGSSFLLNVNDFLLKTSLKERSRILIGPFSTTVNLEAKWCKHSGNPGPQQSTPKISMDLRGGLLQVFWGQEHLNCLALLHELFSEYLKEEGKYEVPVPESAPHMPSSVEKTQAFKTEQSSDDLRTGVFQYVQDAEPLRLPGMYEVLFCSETEESPGMMLWRYPEPRVLTLVRITPVPFNTTEDPDISTTDLSDVLQVPCSLEYWDELQKVFVAFQEFSLSESKVCELQLPDINLVSDQKKLVSSDLWRIVLNSNQNATDDQSSASDSGSHSTCEPLVTPTALAACTRVDSCFTPWFVPSVCVSFQFAHLEFRLCHHLDQLGTASPQHLQPFISDKNVPSELEYMIISFREPNLYFRQWSGGSISQEIRFSSQVDCKLLEFRNVTMQSVVKPFGIFGQIALCSDGVQKLLDCSMIVNSVLVNFGQHVVHSLNTAIQAWKQNKCPEVEELVFSHFVICNDTQETLRFGQVDTDENILLASLHSHQYSWRSHRSPQMLHICIEGWGNWRWSEPFSVDHAGTFIRTIQYKGRTASLIIKVRPLSGVQKQIIICGRQIICSYLSQSIELKVVQHYIGQDGQAVVREHFDCLPAKQKLPSYILENSELTELCVKAEGDEDWSRDVCLEPKTSEYSIVIQVPTSNSSIIYVWCTVLTLEPNSQVQQRMIVFSPLFIMRSHLPDPVIIHLEKRSLGLNETQVIPGKGQENPLQNVEPDLAHHLTFQAREEYDPSDCAVPISTALIKQITAKIQPGGTVNEMLDEFYAPETSHKPIWPYNKKDSDRNEQLNQWDSPMRVKLSIWKPYVRTLLIELLPWALLINQSKWDLWLFEGEKIVLQVPAGKVIIPPNFQEAFQIGIYWANTNTVHKSVAIKLVHNLTSPKWKDDSNGEVVTLDEEAFIDAEIRLGAFPGHQKLCQFCISSMVQHGIQVIQIEDKTTVINNTPYQISYKPQLSISNPYSGKEHFHVPDSATFSICPGGEHTAVKSSSVPCWDFLPDVGPSIPDTAMLQKQILLGFSPTPGADSSQSWSLPAVIRREFPRQSVAVPFGTLRENGFCTRAIALTYQEHFGVTYLTLSEDPSPRVIFHNRCPVTVLIKENIRDIPKFEVYCKKIPSESSIHHELYHQIIGYPDCKTRDLLPSLLLKVELMEEMTTEWSDAVDINSQGTQVVFLTGFGYVYVDITHQCGTVFITLAPEGKAGPILTNNSRALGKVATFRMFITQLSLAVSDDLTQHKASSELLRLTLDNVFLHVSPVPGVLPEEEPPSTFLQLFSVEVYCGDLQLDNQLYSKSNFHFAVLVCQGEKTESAQYSRVHSLLASSKDLEEYKENCFIKLSLTVSEGKDFLFDASEFTFELKPARLYVEDTFVYYLKTLFDTYLPHSRLAAPHAQLPAEDQVLPMQVRQHARALVHPVKLRKLIIQPVSLLVSIHASLKLYIASDHTPLSFSVFERGPVFTTARQLVHALAMHYAAGALFRAGWVVGSLEILGSPASLVRSIGNGISDFFRLPYEGLTRGPGAFVSGVSRGTTSFVKHISKGTLTSITNLATSLARNMDRLSLDEEHYNRQEEWRRQLPESLGEGLRQGLSRLGISLLGAIAGIVDQPMQNFQKTSESQATAGHKAKGVISGVGKGIMGVFTKPIGGAAEFVSQTGYGILHGAGLSQLPKQRYQPRDLQADQAPNSHVKYVWKMLQSLGRPEVHMALDVILVRGSGQEHEGCLLLTSEVLFVVSISEDTQQQAFPITEIDCAQDSKQNNLLTVQLKQPRVACDVEMDGARERLSEQQFNRLVDYIAKTSCHLAPSCSSMQTACSVVAVEPPPATVKTYHYLADPHFAQVFVSKFTMVKNKALRKGFP
ncbi:intermembrane lipid transfer protein VPS13B [Psammomys obesus]|uniref:intermembrane lipid transfer protein VPS13B n=1 Tax=Psammomys obesus TaxID=48139 RepID=UPI002452EF68|nr:intermembrane lipid transfer protein VPS13B [Psammomys obesus]